HAVSVGRPRIPHLRHRRRYRAHAHQLEFGDEEGQGPHPGLLPQHQRLLVDGYHPAKNALYIPYHDACLDMTANSANPQGWGPRRAVMRPGSDPKTFSSIAKVDLSTGRIERIHTQPAPGSGSALVTAGDLLFWGDLNRRFRAFDADSGKILWETVL